LRSLAARADRAAPAHPGRAVPARIDSASPRRIKRVSSRSSYDDLIARASRRHGVPPALVKAVIHAESAFDPRALSPKGAMGLMQLMPATAQLLGVSKPYQASENVEGGTRYLRSLHDRYGSWTHTLAAYNAGPSAVDHYRGVPPYAETRQYVKRVLSYYRRYHGDFAQ
jgi:soluble lytic murein transglycosylase-like protein